MSESSEKHQIMIDNNQESQTDSDDGINSNENSDELKRLSLNAFDKSYLSLRRVSFPENDKDLVTGYLEPANPWSHIKPATSAVEILELYRKSCERHHTVPNDKVIAHLNSCDFSTNSRRSILNLRNQRLTAESCEALEEIFKRIQYNSIDFTGCDLNDHSATALFDMIEYYEATNELNISENKNISHRGLQACCNMVKHSQALQVLIYRGNPMTESGAMLLAKSMMTSSLTIVKLEHCGLTGRPLASFCNLLRRNKILKELWLASNDLDSDDAYQIANMLQLNSHLQYLDLSNNNLQDLGVSYITAALIHQKTILNSEQSISEISLLSLSLGYKPERNTRLHLTDVTCNDINALEMTNPTKPFTKPTTQNLNDTIVDDLSTNFIETIDLKITETEPQINVYEMDKCRQTNQIENSPTNDINQSSNDDNTTMELKYAKVIKVGHDDNESVGKNQNKSFSEIVKPLLNDQLENKLNTTNDNQMNAIITTNANENELHSVNERKRGAAFFDQINRVRSISSESLNSETSIESDDSKSSLRLAEQKFTRNGTLERQTINSQNQPIIATESCGLQVLILWNNKITSSSAKKFSELLSLNKSLEILNIGKNVLSNDFVFNIKSSLKLNNNLQSLGLQSAHLTNDGVKALSEILEFGGNTSLQRIDLRDNLLQVSGLTALNEALKTNKSITRIDLDESPRRNDHSMSSTMDYTRIVNNIRSLCNRNEHPPEPDKIRTGKLKTNLSSRKISLTCTSAPHIIGADKTQTDWYLTEPSRKTAGRLRSPLPSPISSPASSPIASPSRSRFQVSRVVEKTHQNSPQYSKSCSPSNISSRFRVTIVEPPKVMSAPTIVNNETNKIGVENKSYITNCIRFQENSDAIENPKFKEND